MYLVFDGDPGLGRPGADADDGLALALAARAADPELLGVTMVAGNVAVGEATASALETLAALGRPEIPVCVGADRPLAADPTELRAAIDRRRHGELALQFWPGAPDACSVHPPDPRPAPAFLADVIASHPGAVTVVCTGPCTNLAWAFQQEPRLAQMLGQLVVQAGAVRVPGTLTPVTELNAAYDPEALQAVLDAGCPVTLVGLDVTARCFLLPEDVARLRQAPWAGAGWVADRVDPWLRFTRARRNLPGCWLHAALAVSVALEPDLVRTQAMHVQVEPSTARFRGQTIGWDPDRAYLFPHGPPNAEVCVEVDVDRFRARLFQPWERS